MEQLSVILDGEDEALGYSAMLRLRRGAAAWPSWGFHLEDAGSLISVGASAGCDWQVAAPGVQPVSLLFTGKALLIRSDDLDEGDSLNSALLWPGWVPLAQGDILELGASSIEVTRVPFGATDELISDIVPCRETDNDGDPCTGPLRLRHVASRTCEPSDALDLTGADGTDTDLYPAASRKVTQCEAGEEVWATVLDQPSAPPRPLRYIPYTLFFIVAYVAWVVLLERM